MLNLTKRYDYEYTKNYFNNLHTKVGESISLQSSPIHQSNLKKYSRSTNSTPQHFYHVNHHNEKNIIEYCASNKDENLNNDYPEDEHDSSSLEDINGELINQNSSNDEYDNSEESNDGEHCKFNKKYKSSNQSFIKHSRSYQNDFFDFDKFLPVPLDKPTSLSLSLSGNNLSNLNNGIQSPGRKKFEMFIMTGDFILNISKTNSGENSMVNNIMNFKNDKTTFSKQKVGKVKEEKNKLIAHVSNNIKNCVTNSDQMRECLSPEIKINNFDRKNNQPELVCESTDNFLTELLNNEKSLNISSNIINEGNTEISYVKDDRNSPSGLENSLDQPDDLLIPSDISTTEIEVSDSTDDDIISSKRYVTFMQQVNDNLITEQSINSHQKSIDEASAKRLAKRLYNLDKFRKNDVARHLSKNNEFNKAVATEYCNFFDFTGLTLIEALKIFFSKFRLTGVAQERERVLFHFSKRFFTCNPNICSSIDSVYTLTCSLILLNQNLHGECTNKKMNLNDFIENLRSLNNDQNFSRELLEELYNKIKNEKLDFCKKNFLPDSDEDDDALNDVPITNANTILEITTSLNSIEYKRGHLMRKRCLQANNKKVSLGKRKWKSFYAVLRDTVLYLHKDDENLTKNQIYKSVKNSIRIHHAVAFVASDYIKRKYVFRLHTGDGSEYLISLNSKPELDSWIETINLVAACFSAPPSTSIITEKKKYPLKSVLPVNNTTKYQFAEQLNDHEARRIRLNEEIQDLTSQLRLNYKLTDKKAKNIVLQLKYLKHEYERYTAYCKEMKKVKPNSNLIIEKASKNQLSTIKSKPLTNLIIGEEPFDEVTKNLNEKV